MLMKWPKKRPHGYIWQGTNQMRGRLLKPLTRRLNRQVEIEKQNMFYIMHPAVSFEAEDAFHKYMTATQPSKTDLEEMLHRKELEGTHFGPIPISDHYDILERNNKFEKD